MTSPVTNPLADSGLKHSSKTGPKGGQKTGAKSGSKSAETASPSPLSAGPDYKKSAESLVGLSSTKLDQLYASGSAALIPDGASKGKAVFFAGTAATSPMEKVARYIWQGKEFDRAQGTLMNRIVGFKAIRAQVYTGTSLFDSGPAIIIDYEKTSKVFGWIRDEIRLIGPDLYLGRAYGKLPTKVQVTGPDSILKSLKAKFKLKAEVKTEYAFLVYFVLDFRHPGSH